jgi:hypothetical protein
VAGAGEFIVWAGGAAAEAQPFNVEAGVGRVLALRLRRLRDLNDVRSLGASLREAMRRVGRHVIIFSDMRRMAPIPQHLADSWSRDMRAANKVLERAGILLDRDNITFNLQLERVVRCAGNPRRRVFYDKHELRDWLAGSATSAELAHIDELLA